MQYRKDDTVTRYSFGSLREMGEYIATTPKTWGANYSVNECLSQTLNATYDDAVRMARLGWLDGAKNAAHALKAFAPATPAPDTVRDICGFRPHVPAFCAGAPDSMIRHAKRADTGAGRVLTLAVPVNASAATSAQAMSNFGLGVAQYVNQLEADGVRVELIACIVSTVSGVRVAHAWTVKKADQPIDLAVVSFAIGHPAAFRRLGFALRERCSAAEDPGYGYSLDAVPSDFINAPAGLVILNGMKDADRHAQTPQKALAYVTTQIDKALAAQWGG
jgi:hypothetical protein